MAGKRRITPLEHPRIVQALTADTLQISGRNEQGFKPLPTLSWPLWGERPRTGAVLGAAVARLQ